MFHVNILGLGSKSFTPEKEFLPTWMESLVGPVGLAVPGRIRSSNLEPHWE